MCLYVCVLCVGVCLRCVRVRDVYDCAFVWGCFWCVCEGKCVCVFGVCL